VFTERGMTSGPEAVAFQPVAEQCQLLLVWCLHHPRMLSNTV